MGPYNCGVRPIELPSPAEPALAASARLVERIAARIAAAGGWIRFDEFMQAALYEPGLGYYAGGSRKFGAQGDFVTAPELSPLFGACVARQCAQWFGHVPARLWEFGAGSGALAAQVLVELERLGVADVDYAIVELSGELRERQRSTIGAAAPRASARVRWLDAWPASMAGVVLANELLDAMPARAFRWRRGDVLERGVRVRDAGGNGAAAAFEWAERPADAGFEQRVRAALAGPIGEAGSDWPDTYDGELGEQALAWVAEAGRRLERGALLLVDYGFPAHEFYHPQRGTGTLMCHYRHRAHGDPFLWPGLQDITVHVDFTALALAAQGAGLDVLGYASQAAALLNLGLLERFEPEAGDDALARARRAQSVHVLIGDAEMGELFKFVALGRGLPDDAIAFARADRRHRL
ncbi:MAG: SAM-dependent methyltransferase [Burkholderiaceae bacterium]